GGVDAFAANRPNGLAFAARLPGSRVLDDRFTTQQQALALPKGRSAGRDYASEFAEQAKASGLVQQSLTRNGVRGVGVAPLSGAGGGAGDVVTAAWAATLRALGALAR